MSANGKLKSTELVTVQADGMIQLPTAAGSAFIAARAAGHAETGIVMRITTPYGGYRNTAAQKEMNKNPAGTSGTGQVASVGNSVHGKTPGAADISNRRDFGDVVKVGTNGNGDYSRTLDGIMHRHGFHRLIPGEGWHYDYDGITTPPIAPEEDDMKARLIIDTQWDATTQKAIPVGAWYVATAVSKRMAPPGENLQTLVDLGLLQSVNVTPVAHLTFIAIPTVQTV
jgi:hypothetical protein